MRYSRDLPTEPGFYLARGFRVHPTGERTSSKHVWEYAFRVYENDGLRYQGPQNIYGYTVDKLGYIENAKGEEVLHYDVEWARIPEGANPVPQPTALGTCGDCPYLRPIRGGSLSAQCDFLIKDLEFYDWWLAECTWQEPTPPS
jgi:hypothetical protein